MTRLFPPLERDLESNRLPKTSQFNSIHSKVIKTSVWTISISIQWTSRTFILSVHLFQSIWGWWKKFRSLHEIWHEMIRESSKLKMKNRNVGEKNYWELWKWQFRFPFIYFISSFNGISRRWTMQVSVRFFSKVQWFSPCLEFPSFYLTEKKEFPSPFHW